MMVSKHALVSGGSSGIGFAIAKSLSQAGYQLTLLARNENRLINASQAIGADYRRADVSVIEDVKAAVAGLNPIDLLVNAAGFVKGVSASTQLEEGEAAWNAVIDANLKGTFLLSLASIPLLRAPGGRIVNISSIAASTGGSRPGSIAYAAAKSGIHGLTFAMARELAPYGITVNAIAPGFIENTGLTEGWDAGRVKSIIAETPVGRAGRPSDIASIVTWLASEASSFLTGAVIPINGGWRIGNT